jgi:hypothetical protein
LSSIPTFTIGESLAVKAKCISGNYIKMQTSGASVDFGDSIPLAPGIYISGSPTEDWVSIDPGLLHIMSFYADAPRGLFAAVQYYKNAGTFIRHDVLPISVHENDRNGNGWVRQVGRTKPPADAEKAWVGIFAHIDGTYLIEAPQFEPVNRGQGASKWHRDKPLKPWADDYVDVNTASYAGATTINVTGLITAGMHVNGVYGIALTSVTYLTPTSPKVDIGDSFNSTAFAKQATFSATGNRSAKNGTGEMPHFYATGDTVVLTLSGAVGFSTGTIRLYAKNYQEADVPGV